MATLSTSALASQYQTYFSKDMLKYQVNVLQLQNFGKLPVSMPKNLGMKQVSWFRWGNADDTQVQTLTEGTPISQSRDLALTQITASLKQFGEKVTLTDILTMTQLYDAAKQASKTMGEDSALKADSVCRNVLVTSDDTGNSASTSGITERFAQGLASFSTLGTAAAGASYLDAQDVLDGVTKLRVNKTPPITGTNPMIGGYVFVVPPQVGRDLKRDPDWLEASKYSDVQNLWKGEIGSIYGVRVVEATNPFIETTSTQYVHNTAGTIYSNLMFGDSAYGVVPIAGNNISAPSMYILDQADKSDPLNQTKVIGWKLYWIAKLLNSSFCLNLRSKSRWS